MNENVRIGDQEREEAVKRLGEHYEAGRLTAEEHSERISQALQARTAADLAGLFADLPGEQQRADVRAEQPQRPPWASKGPFRKVPLPVLMALAALAVLLSVGCAVG